MDVEKYAYYVKKLAKTLVWKHEHDVKLWLHKQHTPNTNDHHVPLNENSPMKIFCVRHWSYGRIVVIFIMLSITK